MKEKGKAPEQDIGKKKSENRFNNLEVEDSGAFFSEKNIMHDSM